MHFSCWTPEEDALLTRLVQTHGTKSWALVAAQMPSRQGKQARDRWLNHLAPELSKRPWSAEEDEIILRAQQELGNKWTLIAKRLQGRSENAVKNHWHSKLCRLRKPSANMPVAEQNLPLASEAPAAQGERRARPWSEDETKILALALDRVGPDWRAVSRYYLPQRSPVQIAAKSQKLHSPCHSPRNSPRHLGGPRNLDALLPTPKGLIGDLPPSHVLDSRPFVRSTLESTRAWSSESSLMHHFDKASDLRTQMHPFDQPGGPLPLEHFLQRESEEAFMLFDPSNPASQLPGNPPIRSHIQPLQRSATVGNVLNLDFNRRLQRSRAPTLPNLLSATHDMHDM